MTSESTLDKVAALAGVVGDKLSLQETPESTESVGQSPRRGFSTRLIRCDPAAAHPQPVILYVDEKSGSDSIGTGTKTSPFASALAAYLSLGPQRTQKDPFALVNLQILKPAASAEGAPEYTEITASAKKKLVKGIEAHWKKVEKQEKDGERLAKEKAEAEERDRKRRIEAGKVVLELDEAGKSLGKVSFRRVGDLPLAWFSPVSVWSPVYTKGIAKELWLLESHCLAIWIPFCSFAR